MGSAPTAGSRTRESPVTGEVVRPKRQIMPCSITSPHRAAAKSISTRRCACRRELAGNTGRPWGPAHLGAPEGTRTVGGSAYRQLPGGFPTPSSSGQELSLPGTQ